MKKYLTILLALGLLATLAACGQGEAQSATGAVQTTAPTTAQATAPAQTEPSQTIGQTLPEGQAEYRVSVVDALGSPYTSGVIVRFMQGGQQVSMQVVNEEGVAIKVLEAGEYTVELQFTDKDASFHYDTADLMLTAEKNQLQVVMAKGVSGKGQDLFAYSLLTDESADHTAYPVDTGCTYVELVSGERNYFLFTPTESGTYEFSVTEGTVGYYGAPHFVQSANAAEASENGVVVSVRPDMISTGNTGTAVLVIGVDAGAEQTAATLVIERLGEHQHTVADEPWTEMVTTHTPTPFTFPGGTLSYVDIYSQDTGKYQAVKGEDGMYHLNTADGPVLYVNLGEDSPVESLQTIIQGSGYSGGAPLRKYFYDENNQFVKKEDYTELMMTYFANMDQDVGVYPLNDDLVYMIQQGCGGWWDETSPDYIFEGCNPELGWMFAVCYVK